MLRFLLLTLCLTCSFCFSQTGLQVLSATYGEGRNQRDVTAMVQSRIQNSMLRVQADPAMLGGDPAPGVVKSLRIRYSIDGVVNDVIAQDGEWISVPGNARQTVGGILRSRQNRDPQLRILFAQYGEGSKQSDVTAMLNSRIQNDALSLAVNNSTMGVDPSMGKVKALKVTYQWQGQTFETRVAEDALLTLPDPQQSAPNRDQATILDRITGRNALKIVSAQYGAKNKFNDVRALLEQKMVNNAVSIVVNNQTMGGDPIVATKKSLKVTYQWLGRSTDVTVDEDGTLNIPSGAAPATSGGFFGGMISNTNQLRILSATYGSSNRTLDVTNLLNTRIQNNSLTINATNEIMGPDPAVGADKVLRVSWTLNGKTQETSVNEGKTLRIP